MIDGKRVVVVMPAYNAEQTLRQTFDELPREIVDEVILVDDASSDGTVAAARALGIEHVLVHPRNRGYGGNQKTCYEKALALGADIVIMVHPDYQYTPRLIPAMASMIASGLFDCVLASRILGTGALEGGMPWHKYFFNRLLTFFQNLMVDHKLSEYHTGYRAWSADVLRALPLDDFSDDFIFDNQILLSVIARGARIGEVSCPTRYMAEASSIGGWPVIRYGLGVLRESVAFRLARHGLGGGLYARVLHRQAD